MRAFHLLSADHALEAVRNQRLKVARFHELNDPFELLAADLSGPRDRRAFTKFKAATTKKLGLLCFSRRWKNPLVWSHYADKHRGVALEFKINDDFIQTVRYSDSRMRLNASYVMSHGGFTENLAYRIATTKSKHWAYEDEVRIAVRLAECIVENGIHFEQLTEHVKIVGIVLGALSSLTSQDLQGVLPKGRRLTLRHARLAFRSFNIVRNRARRIEVIHGVA